MLQEHSEHSETDQRRSRGETWLGCDNRERLSVCKQQLRPGCTNSIKKCKEWHQKASLCVPLPTKLYKCCFSRGSDMHILSPLAGNICTVTKLLHMKWRKAIGWLWMQRPVTSEKNPFLPLLLLSGDSFPDRTGEINHRALLLVYQVHETWQ